MLNLSDFSADEISQPRYQSDRMLYARWFAGLNDEEKAFARLHGIDRYASPHARPSTGGSDPDVEFGDPSDLPEASIDAHPVDQMEPLRQSVDVDSLSQEEVGAAAEDFETALRWALDGGKDLVALGKRSAVLIAGLRGDLAGGLVIDKPLARSFLGSFQGRALSETAERLQATGSIYARFLEWMRRATSLSGLGERLQLVAYKLRPDLIDAGTLAELGNAVNKTRQAKDKGVNCLRDTFAGLKAISMRGEVTRLRCRNSHLQIYESRNSYPV